MGIFDIFLKKKPYKEERVLKKKEPVTNFSNFKIITDYIYKKSGIVDLDKRALTASRLQQYAISQDIYNSDNFLKKMQNEEKFYQEVLNIATVNETFFMREERELKWLIEYIKNSKNNLTLLSMPSSSGEEIYSILLMMDIENIPLDKVSITGYDINSNAIKNAIDGIYDEHSLHKIAEDVKKQYFNVVDENSYQVIDRLRRCATFYQQNIFELKNTTHKFDIILSRNMFIYFDDKKRKEASEIIINMLKKDAIFIKGHADNIYEFDKLQKLSFGIYKKT
jgi:chemotaxis protein methyltransferase CheR